MAEGGGGREREIEKSEHTEWGKGWVRLGERDLRVEKGGRH